MGGAADCVFCKIIAGAIPSHLVYEDDAVRAFLDIGPLSPGHLLLVPIEHYRTMEETPEQTAASLGAALPRLVSAVRQATGAAGVNVLQNNGRCAGQEVEHVHVHIIPRSSGDGLGYRWHPKSYQPGEAETIRDRIKQFLQG